MSHFLLNKKLITSTINNNKHLSDEGIDKILCSLYESGKIKGGPDLMNQTIIWFENKYSYRFSLFLLLLRNI